MARFFELPELPGFRFPWYGRMPDDLWTVLRQFVYERDGGVCQYTGVKVELHKCHCHHVLPLSEGGTNHPTNLKIVAKEAHERRHPHMLDPLARLQS